MTPTCYTHPRAAMMVMTPCRRCAAGGGNSTSGEQGGDTAVSGDAARFAVSAANQALQRADHRVKLAEINVMKAQLLVDAIELSFVDERSPSLEDVTRLARDIGITAAGNIARQVTNRIKMDPWTLEKAEGKLREAEGKLEKAKAELREAEGKLEKAEEKAKAERREAEGKLEKAEEKAKAERRETEARETKAMQEWYRVESALTKPGSRGMYEQLCLTADGPKFSGDDRQRRVKETCDNIVAASRKMKTKEYQPIFAVFAAPRQGKSRFVDEVFKRLRSSHCNGQLMPLAITFNNNTVLSPNTIVQSETDVRREVGSRMIFELLQAFPWKKSGVRNDEEQDLYHTAGKLNIELIYAAPFWPHISLSAVAGLAARMFAVHENRRSSEVRVVLLADEFSRLIDTLQAQRPETGRHHLISAVAAPLYGQGGYLVATGFTRQYMWILSTASRRQAHAVPLCAVSPATASSYVHLRHEAESKLGAQRYSTYLSVRFSPGLLGLVVESGLKQPPPIVLFVGQALNEGSDWFKAHCCNVACLPLDVKTFTYLEEKGVLLLTADAAGQELPIEGAAYNPYLVLETFKQMSLPHEVENVVQKFQITANRGSQHSNGRVSLSASDKGDLLELLLESALLLRATYSPAGGVCADKFFDAVLGRDHNTYEYGPSISRGCQPPRGAKLTFTRPADSRHVVSFPVHCETKDSREKRSAEEKEQHLERAREVIRHDRVPVFRPSAKYNIGCDVALMAKYEAGGKMHRCCFLFECKHMTSTDGGKENHYYKAARALTGILFGHSDLVSHVAFTFIKTTAEDLTYNIDRELSLEDEPWVSYAAEFKALVDGAHSEPPPASPEEKWAGPTRRPRRITLRQVIDALAKKGVTVSLHVVQCPTDHTQASPQFRHLMMYCFEYMIPSFELPGA